MRGLKVTVTTGLRHTPEPGVTLREPSRTNSPRDDLEVQIYGVFMTPRNFPPGRLGRLTIHNQPAFMCCYVLRCRSDVLDLMKIFREFHRRMGRRTLHIQDDIFSIGGLNHHDIMRTRQKGEGTIPGKLPRSVLEV